MSVPGGVNQAIPHGEVVEESVRWRLAALLLQRPHSDWRREIVSLSDEAGHARLKVLAFSARDADEAGYLRIFGPGGLVSPREVGYCPKEDPGRVLADIAGYYGAFAFRSGSEDPMDHIGVEADFAGFLCLKEAYALTEGNQSAAETVNHGLSSFITAHLLPFARALRERFETVESGYLSETVDCLLDLVQGRVGGKPSEQA